MIYGYARVSTDGQSVDAQVARVDRRWSEEMVREVASSAKTDRAQLRRLIEALTPGDVLTVARLDRLARSTRDLLNVLAAVTEKRAGFRPGHHDPARPLDAYHSRRPSVMIAKFMRLSAERAGDRDGASGAGD